MACRPLISFIMMSDTGRVSSCKSFTARVPGARRLAGLSELSRMARQRLKWMDYNWAHGRNAALTWRCFGISRQTFYRWKRHYDPGSLLHLGGPHPPTKAPEATYLVPGAGPGGAHLREQYPRWEKSLP